MNSKQRFACLLGVFIIAYMGTNPPWKEAGPKGLPLEYAPIYAPPVPKRPDAGLEIDFARLLLQVGVTAILTGGLVAAGGEAAARGSEAQIGQDHKGSSTARIEGGKDEIGQEKSGQGKSGQDKAERPEPAKIVAMPGKRIKFPGGKNYGEFLVESDDDDDAWEWFADAEGEVELPRGRPVQLEVTKGSAVDLSFVTLLDPDSLHSMDLSETEIKDWELANLKKLTGLKELDLSSTGVTSEVFKYLEGLTGLRKLWLDDTRVDDGCVARVKNLPALQKLSLTNTGVTESGAKELADKLSNCEVVI
ncbi:MAG: hypothetical protein IPM23_14100 [Candidatus Melainabacteria bacterium]|nr:hypothetical protein [Candidatus Melainabacteria bacterium]